MKLKISVDSKVYEVEVDILEDDRQSSPVTGYAPLRSSGTSLSISAGNKKTETLNSPESVADESKVCRSPIMGIVVRINVQVGQEIHVNDPLLVLEAMKMESSITAPISGKVKEVRVKAGDGVENRQILVVFE